MSFLKHLLIFTLVSFSCSSKIDIQSANYKNDYYNHKNFNVVKHINLDDFAYIAPINSPLTIKSGYRMKNAGDTENEYKVRKQILYHKNHLWWDMKVSMVFYLHMTQENEADPITINMCIETGPDGTKYTNCPTNWTIKTTSVRHATLGHHYIIGDKLLTLEHPRIYIKYSIDSFGKDWESEIEIKLNPYYLLETKDGYEFNPVKILKNDKDIKYENLTNKPFVEISEKIMPN